MQGNTEQRTCTYNVILRCIFIEIFKRGQRSWDFLYFITKITTNFVDSTTLFTTNNRDKTKISLQIILSYDKIILQ